MLDEAGVTVKVITTSIEGKQRAIALAVWELMFQSASNFLDIGTSCGLLRPVIQPLLRKLCSSCPTAACDHRRDADVKHMDVFDKACAKAKKEYFDNVYGTDQIHLRILATHPDWQRHGAATIHCNWGMQLATAKHIPVTVLSSPLGGKLYTHLDFTTLGHFTVQVEGEEEKLSIGAMIKEYEKHKDDQDDTDDQDMTEC
ncbi:hypothetical protein BS50DRAFT_579876 [Corynespora cassiicola Philippines]|uniref:N-acetyltransferase domain-containing protein n=1 Tax=Corynespora cassiicola Philippines TaxID=1448308 RepID=A0A2T2N2K3_CORCC|nr:hypothetical protein BS50DRAFT_579876 [Corynespora cassiicola Philippines]